MKTIEEITNETKSVLKSKHFSVQCQYCGVVRESEINRADSHGEAELRKLISDSDIIEAVNDCIEDAGSIEDVIVNSVLGILASKNFVTYYDSIIFVVNVW